MADVSVTTPDRAKWAAKLRVAAERLEHDERTRAVPFDRVRRRRFLAAIEAGVAVAAAARYVGIAPATAYLARERDDSFAKAWEQAYEASCAAVEERVESIALEGDASSMATVRAAELFLSGRSPRYRKQAGTATATVKAGADGGSLTVRVGAPGVD